MIKKQIFAITAIMALVLTSGANTALAHGHTSFKINEKIYSFTVGSLNEPIAVDDKTGLDLHVTSMPHHEGEHHEDAGTPVVGLEKSLKLELIAGDKKKTLDISAAYNDPGAYRAYFVPTIQTTFSYRLFGTIDNVPFNYTFTCNPAGHPVTPDNKTEVEISPGVVRIESAGAFGCPAAKGDLGFPESSVAIADLNAQATSAMEKARSAKTKGLIGIVLSLGSLAVAVVALRRSRRVTP